MKNKRKPIFILFVFIIFSLITFYGCGLLESSTGIEIDKNTLEKVPMIKGITNQKIQMGEAGILLYTLSVPEIKEGETVPFIIALHWAGVAKVHFSEDYLRGLAEPGFRDLGAIVFAPDVPGYNWNDEFSEDAILKFLEAAKQVWPINPNKVVITGYSMGGNGTWYMIDKHPNKFCAGIPMASVPSGKLTGELPIYIIHGKKDELFDYKKAESAYNILKSKGANVRISLPENLSHYQGFSYVKYLQEASSWLQTSFWE
ncbi:MAG: dienelactone hydrolase family protein [Ignavibacteriales bacterium]|nr:dienelactone hydrolase family protein [Ignavibacteriota bacterium]MCB9219820.1 dienelactone hydrolase family protein [Ignavibacteriales bacterium]